MAKEQGYFVVIHPDHPAIMEIMDDTQYSRMRVVEPEFVPVAHVETKDAALDAVMEKLRIAYQKDPTLQNAKSVILDSLKKK